MEKKVMLMSLTVDLKVHEQYSPATTVSNNTFVPSGGSFSEVFSAACQVSGGTNYEKYFQLAADTYQIPVNLIKALTKAESDFNANSVSRCGAQGLMQLMPSTARAMGVTDAFDPAQNIMGGTKYLRQMLDTFDGDIPTALAAYNAGPGAIKKHGGMLPSQEGYVNKILRYAGYDPSANSTISAISGISSDLTDTGEVSSVSDASLTQEILADQILQAYSPGSTYNQEYVRILLQQILLKNLEKQEEDELNVSL